VFRNGLQPWHLLVLAIVIIVMFGSKRLPDSARALGRSLRILKSEARAMKDDPGPARPAGADLREEEPRTIQAAPGDTASARPARAAEQRQE